MKRTGIVEGNQAGPMTHDQLENQRLVEMRAKKKVSAVRIPCKVHNIAFPGEQIEAAVNGVNFTVQDGVSVMLTRGQIEVLRNAKVETEHWEGDPDNPNAGPVRKIPVVIPRFSVEIQTDEIENLMAKLQAVSSSSQSEANEKAPSPGTPGMLSGRTE